MTPLLKNLWNDKEKRARLLFWIWILSLVMTVIGYVIIFYMLFWKK